MLLKYELRGTLGAWWPSRLGVRPDATNLIGSAGASIVRHQGFYMDLRWARRVLCYTTSYQIVEHMNEPRKRFKRDSVENFVLTLF